MCAKTRHCVLICKYVTLRAFYRAQFKAHRALQRLRDWYYDKRCTPNEDDDCVIIDPPSDDEGALSNRQS